ncbi:MAG: hypothetical protein IKX86_00520 [Clostridia bacterium]|nr:hypothetical protein [Clostridia bacterium]
MIKFTLTVKHLDLAPLADRMIPRLTGSDSPIVNGAAKKMLFSLPEEKQEELLVSLLGSDRIDPAAELQKMLAEKGIKAEITEARADRI